MITNITLENFKCFRHVSINPKLLTVLIGPNGTGKSSVLQALLLLKQSVGEDRLQRQGKFINVSNSSTFVPNYSPLAPTFHLGFAGTYQPYGTNADEMVEFRYDVEFAASGSMRDYYGEIKSLIGEDVIKASKEIGGDLTPRQFDLEGSRLSLAENRGIGSLVSFMSQSPVGRSTVRNLAQLESEEAHRIGRMVYATGNILKAVKYVPSVRGLIRPRYDLADELLEDVSIEAGLSDQEEQTASNIGYSRALEEKMSNLMKRVTGTGLRAEPVPPQAVE